MLQIPATSDQQHGIKRLGALTVPSLVVTNFHQSQVHCHQAACTGACNVHQMSAWLAAEKPMKGTAAHLWAQAQSQ